VLICLLLSGRLAFSQEDPGELAQRLTRNCQTEKEKVTAIFNWITENIAYRVRSPQKAAIIGKHSLKYVKSYEEPGDTGPLKPLNERIGITVLKNREATCEGYANLFKTLCDYAGIRSSIVAGYARPLFYKPRTFGVNHKWNAVLIDGNWHLLDATWASGYVTRYGNEFVKEYDPAYFLSKPEEFIRDHYPDDIRWTLLPDTKVPPEFNSSPFQQKSFNKYSIVSFYPSKGVIEATVGDTIRLELATADAAKDKVISPDMLVDSTIFSTSGAWVFLKPSINILGTEAITNKHSYILPVTKPGIEWVYLLYNEDMVLRYKVNVRE
jgi:transglutaminase-like putative cysteine protease